VANWCNVRLSVFGTPAEIKPFRNAAGALGGRIDAAKSAVFLEEMEIGESRDLEAWGESSFRRRFRRAEYVFQGRNTDHLDHFVEVSKRYPRLVFVLTYSDPNGDDHGSHLIVKGRSRSWRVPMRTRDATSRRAYRRYGCVDGRGRIDYDHDYADLADWEALSELMRIASVKWDAKVLELLQRHARPARAVNSPR
jgi:hypothetical protein